MVYFILLIKAVRYTDKDLQIPEKRKLPAPDAGPRNSRNAFLPAVFQGAALGRSGVPAKETAFCNRAGGRATGEAKRQFDLPRELNAKQLRAKPGDSELEAVIASYERAWRMQSRAPDVVNFAGESDATKALYGIGEKDTDNYGRECLMARQLCEACVRYVHGRLVKDILA